MIHLFTFVGQLSIGELKSLSHLACVVGFSLVSRPMREHMLMVCTRIVQIAYNFPN